jgi:hypothetical protein
MWGQWLVKNDERALSLAAGASTIKQLHRQEKGELPPEVVALLAIADLREIVLEIATAIDVLRSRQEER